MCKEFEGALFPRKCLKCGAVENVSTADESLLCLKCRKENALR